MIDVNTPTEIINEEVRRLENILKERRALEVKTGLEKAEVLMSEISTQWVELKRVCRTHGITVSVDIEDAIEGSIGPDGDFNNYWESSSARC